MHSDRIIHPLSNNVYFVRIHEDSLVIHIEFHSYVHGYQNKQTIMMLEF